MPIPTHQENPDLYDFGDSRPISSYPPKGGAEMRAMMEKANPEAYAAAAARAKRKTTLGT
jgi:hypothetical protein